MTLHECIRCKRMRPAHSHADSGSICQSCYGAPPRLCGICQQINQITVRKTENVSNICGDCCCGTCVVCGQFGTASSTSARSSTDRATWPVGSFCDTCYNRRKRKLAPCSQRSTLPFARSSAGRAGNGDNICGPRCDIDFACHRCSYTAAIYADGLHTAVSPRITFAIS